MRFLIISIALSCAAYLSNAQIEGTTSVNAGDTETYSVDKGALFLMPTWVVQNGTSLNQWKSGTTYFITIVWNTTSTSGQITFKNGSTTVASASITISSPPSVPPNPTASTNACGAKTLTRQGTPPTGVSWYWQTSSAGTSTAYSGTTYNVNSSGTYYLRARNNTGGLWSTTSASIAVTVTQTPSTPPTPTIAYNCGSAVLTSANPPSGVTYYWQSSSTGTSTANSAATLGVGSSGTYYLRAKNSSCWSSIRSVAVNLSSTVSGNIGGALSSTTGFDRTYSFDTGGSSLLAPQWTPANGTVLSSSVQGSVYNVVVRWGTPGTGSVTLCNGGVIVKELNGITIIPLPATPPHPTASTNTCGDKTLQQQGTPPSGVKWYWQTTSSGTSTALGYQSTRAVNTSGTYYLRAKNDIDNAWSTGSGSVSVTVTQTPSTPPTPTIAYNCGSAVLTRANPPSGVTYYWQSSSTGTSTANSAATLGVGSSGTYYLRAKNSSCWSSVRSVVVNLSSTVSGNISGGLSSTTGFDRTYAFDTGGPSLLAPQWTAENGTVLSSSVQGSVYSVVVRWGTPGTGSVTLCNGGVIVKELNGITIIPIPATPPHPTASTNTCGDKTLQQQGTPPSGVKWYWQTVSSGTSTALGYQSTRAVNTSGTYYLRAKNNIDNAWSTGSGSVSVTVTQTPSTPPTPTIAYNCGSAVLTSANPPSGVTYYWQSSSTGTSTANSAATLDVENSGTYYLRAKSSSCWSSSQSVAVNLSSTVSGNISGDLSSTTGFDRTYAFDTGGPSLLTPQWTAVNGTVLSSSVQGSVYSVVVRWGTPGTGSVRLCNGGVIVKELNGINIIPLPATPPHPTASTNACGDKTLQQQGTPPSGVKWYWQTASSGTSTALGYQSTRAVNTSGTYYLRAKNDIDDAWSTGSGSVSVTVTQTPLAPPTPTIAYNCESAVLTRDNPPSDVAYYWQSSLTGTSTENDSNLLETTVGGTYYLRANSASCWSETTIVEVDFSPSSSLNIIGSHAIEDGIGTYWIDGDAYFLSPTWSVTGGTVVSSEQIETYYSATVHWGMAGPGRLTLCNGPGVASILDVTIRPPRPIVSSNFCGEATLTRPGSPSVGSKWYWQTSAEGTSTSLGYEPELSSISSGTYYLRSKIDNGAWGPHSAPYHLTVKPKPDAPSGAQNGARVNPGNVYLAVANDGLKYHWYLNSVYVHEGSFYEPILFETTTFNVFAEENGCSSVNSINVTGEIISLPTITSSNGFFLQSGQSTVLSVPDEFLTYQWKKDGIEITSATTHQYTTSSSGTYTVELGFEGQNHYETASVKIRLLHNEPTDNDNPTLVNNPPPNIPDAGNINYVRTYTPEIATSEMGVANIHDFLSNDSSVVVSTQYIDGLGRPIQTVLKKGSPMGNDIVQSVSYDNRGRSFKEYLPYAANSQTGGYQNNAIWDQYQFYRNMSDTDPSSGAYRIARTGVPYAEKTYTSLNEVSEQGSPGEAWSISEGKPIKILKRPFSHTEDEPLIDWGIANQVLVKDGFFKDGDLMVSITEDENGQQTREYTNKRGQQILKRVEGDGEWLNTYYVYDIYGHLRFVLPPMANQKLEEGATIDDTFLAQWAYQYKYDGRKRMIEKRVPGAGWVHMVYDDRDRLVLTQDGNQRLANKWSFTKYDALNRPIITGEKVINNSLANLRDLLNGADWLQNYAAYETLDGDKFGYTSNSLPKNLSLDEIYTVTYYDNYDFNHASSYPFVSELGHEDAFDHPKGLVTGTKTKTLDDTNTWLESVSYYDDRYRPIQTINLNQLGGIDRTSNKYDFVDKVLKSHTVHENGTESKTVVRRFEYDHAGRLLKTYHQVDSNDEVLLSGQNYNELGELIEKNLHVENNVPQQSIDYRYNIRGWLASINDAGLAGDEDDYFGMELFYSHGFDQVNHNGNISGAKWKSFGTASTQSYGYVYDAMNRLRSGTFAKGSGANWENLAGAFNTGYSYDLNGNIKQLHRNGATGAIDQLTYDYGAKGNQLQTVEDAITDTEGFVNGHNGTLATPDYGYDANGNMTTDRNKGIASIEYNHLNLPEVVTKADGQYIKYIYDASGAKLAQEVYDASNNRIKRTDYIGEFIYETEGTDATKLALIQHDEGRIVPNAISENWDYQYHLSDHLGNTRVTFTTKPNTFSFKANYENDPDNADDIELFEDVQIAAIGDFNATEGTYADGTAYGHSQVLRSSPYSQLGSAIAIPVGAGDKITASVLAKYVAAAEDPNVTSTSLASALISAFTGTPGAGNTEGAIGTINDNFGSGSLIGGTGFPYEDANAPKAFLNLMFLPDGNAIDLVKDASFAYAQIADGTTEAVIDGVSTSPFDELRIENFVAPKNGYILVYLSNEGSLTDVYFDDMEITVDEHPVIQKDDYYPFGMQMAGGYQRMTAKENRFKLSGNEELEEWGDGIYDFNARIYESSIGRFMSTDPLADKRDWLTPYNYSRNNPIAFIDPNGLLDIFYANNDGSIERVEQEGAHQFYVQTSTGNRGAYAEDYRLAGTLTENDNGLVEFPLSGLGFGSYGTTDAGGTSTNPAEEVGQGDHYVTPETAAALYGVINRLNNGGINIDLGDMSSSNGSDPWQVGFEHHAGHGHNGNRSGIDVDFRYVNTDGNSFQSANAFNNPSFSSTNNQTIYDTSVTYGFTVNYQGTSGNLNGPTNISGHNDHGHIGRTNNNTNVTTITNPKLNINLLQRIRIR